MNDLPISKVATRWLIALACPLLWQGVALGDGGFLSPELQEWLGLPAAERAELPADLDRRFGDAGEAEAHRDALWEHYRNVIRALGRNALLPAPTPIDEWDRGAGAHGAARHGDWEMPFFFFSKGEKPGSGWPLFVAMHGGGGTPARLDSPHGWEVNTREWMTQGVLVERVYPEGLYIVPRMHNDNVGRWWKDACQVMVEDLVRAAVLFHGVDSNRVHLIGVSEGGYAAFRMPAHQPDRWAGAGPMAAAEPIENAPPINFRNTALRADIGEHDTPFDRIGLARAFFEKIERLRTESPHDYDFHFEVYEGRGHGIPYDGAPNWLADKTRNPFPERISWQVDRLDTTIHRTNHWLVLEEEPAETPLRIEATRAAGEIGMTVVGPDGEPATGLRLRVLLDAASASNLREIRINGQVVHEGALPLTTGAQIRSLLLREDPDHVFPADVVVRVP